MAELHRDHVPPTPSPQNRTQNEGMDQAARALSYLISGVLVWGGLGWLADHFLHTRFFTPIGIILGAGLACYLIIVHFGQLSRTASEPEDDSSAVDHQRSTTPSDMSS